jgi:DNA-binding NtrC family response regulator
MIGISERMQRVYDLIGRAAPTDGHRARDGRERHRQGARRVDDPSALARRMGPFLAINCGAVSATLVESELFGHERGSFTGRLQRHRGHFERAAGGTLFLDEVTEMPMELQVKLLRVLETRNVLRVGGSTPVEGRRARHRGDEPRPGRGRERGKLREDPVLSVERLPDRPAPAARSRRGPRAPHAPLPGTARRGARTPKHLTTEVLARFERYGWPGNVRELKNVIERAYILADDQIEASHIPADVGVPEVELPEQSAAPPLKVGTSLADAERRLIMATLTHFAGDKRRAAETLGISLKTLYNRLNSYRGAA